MRFVWLILGLISVGLAVIGIALPLLPTVPFLLLAAFFFARSSERLHNWLLTHPTFGPFINDWNQSKAIRPKAKRLATLSVVAVLGVSILLKAPVIVIVIQCVTLSLVMLFIWTRPNG
ncbi:MAG: YbaN family protein [Rhodobacteraceae bacterium]|nr:YbaN family protein [Paracoccaceae bacterium]